MAKIIAIPTDGNEGLTDNVAYHFGRCKTFTLLDEEGKILEVIPNTSEHMGGKGMPPALLKKHGVDILLCKSLGPRAIDMCTNLGMQVYVCELPNVTDIFKEWKQGKLQPAGEADACAEHAH